MKIQVIKQSGGSLIPSSDLEADKLAKFKTGEQYEVEIKLSRNPAFHRKVFAFFNFCFEHWAGDDMQCEAKQFDVFRNQLTCLAGFYDELQKIGGGVRIEAKSLSFSSMSQEEFEKCYSGLINAAMKNIFKSADQSVYDRLISFF